MAKIIIHHLSDIHFGRFAAPRPGAQSIAGGQASFELAEQYLNFLERASELPDYIVASGDFASTAALRELEDAAEFLTQAIGKTSARGKKIKVLAVPGNHDVDWEQDGERRFEAFHNTIGKISLVSTPATVAFRDSANNVLFWLIDSARMSGIENPKAAQLLGLLRKLLNETPRSTEFETAWKEFERIDPGMIDRDTLQSIDRHLDGAPENELRIAVLHHPISPFPWEDLDQFPVAMNSGAFKRRLQELSFDLVLHGHLHTAGGFYEDVAIDEDNRGFYISSAASLGGIGPRDQGNSFNAIEVNRDNQLSDASAEVTIKAISSDGYRFRYPKSDTVARSFFRGSQTVARVTESYRKTTVKVIKKRGIGQFILEMDSALNALSEPDGYDPTWMQVATLQLEKRRVYAVDIQGMNAWSKPVVFQYFLQQALRRRDMLGCDPLVTPALHTGVARAAKHYCEKVKRPGSSSPFAKISAPADDKDVPFELIRILVWTPEEFRRPGAQSIVDMHEAALIPCFYLDRCIADQVREAELREMEYVVFSNPSSDLEGWYYSPKWEIDHDKPLRHGLTDDGLNLLDDFNRMFEQSSLLLARDALTIYGNDRAGAGRGPTLARAG